MAFHSILSDLEETSNTFIMTERDRSDSADTCACPTTAGLSKAVSVSLGLDTMSSPISNMNQCSSNSAYSDFDPTAENSSRGVSELGVTRNMNSGDSVILMRDTNQREGDFREVCHNAQQVSCMDLLRSGEMDSAQTVTRGPVISRYVRQESNSFMNPVVQPPEPSQLDELLPLKPYPAYSANPNLYRDAPAAWRVYSGQSEPERGGTDGHNLLCKYCYCGQASRGSRQECHCVCWYSKGEQGRKGGTRAVMTQEYGQGESFQSAIPQGHATFPAIKTEPSVWVDCTDRNFR